VSPVPAGWPPPDNQQQTAATLRYARLRDPIGDRVQFVFAAMYLLTLAMAGTTAKDIAWGALAVCALARLPLIWRCYTVLLRDRLLWLLAAWTAWRLLSLLWSPDTAQGLDECAAGRVLLTPLLMWPVLDRATLLVSVFLVGVFGHNLVQLSQAMHWFGLEPTVNQRLDGLLHPIHLGALCLAAMTWQVSALIHGRGARPATIALWLVGLGAATTGLVFTGSRGPWIAAAVVIPMTVLIIAIRRPATRRAALALAVGGLVAGAVSWSWTGDYVRFRLDQAVTQFAVSSTDPANLDTEVGWRLGRWLGAGRIALDHPLAGTGAGGYGHAMAEGPYREITARTHHAHSLYLHDAATLGFAGLGLTLVVLFACLSRAWSDPPRDRYGDGSFFVLAGWLIGAGFDCYQFSGTMFGLFSMVIALTMPWRARSLTASQTRSDHDGSDSDHQQDA